MKPLPYYRDQHDLSDLLLCAILKGGIICVVFVLFEVHMLNMHLSELKSRLGRVYIKIHYCSVICIRFNQRSTSSSSSIIY